MRKHLIYLIHMNKIIAVYSLLYQKFIGKIIFLFLFCHNMKANWKQDQLHFNLMKGSNSSVTTMTRLKSLRYIMCTVDQIDPLQGFNSHLLSVLVVNELCFTIIQVKSGFLNM